MTTAQTLDLEPIVRTLSILDKRGRIVPLEPNWMQVEILHRVRDDFEAGRPSRILVLKGRQLGCSTICEAILYATAATVPNTNGAVIAHESQPAEYLFGMTKRYHETWEFSDVFGAKYSSRRQLTLGANDSTIYVMTAENPDALRGRTYSVVHGSEVAFWKDPVAAMIALNAAMPAVRGNIQILETTANGIGGWFHETWEDAVAGKNEYTPMFFPWWKHYEYIPCQGIGCRDGTCETCVKATKNLKARDSDERDLLRMGATKAHVAWRRWAIPNRCLNNIDLWNQEFPATAEIAFIASGVNAFNLDDLRAVYAEEEPDIGRIEVSGGGPRFVMDPEGPWKIYRSPAVAKTGEAEWGTYWIGADPSFGSVDGDFAAAQIINRRTKEQVAVFHGKIDPGAFADQLALAGKLYNEATIACETEGGGLVTVERLRHIYPRLYFRRTFDVVPGQDRSDRSLGWSTNWKTKAQLILKGSETVAKGACVIHDEATFREMRTYSFYSGKGFNDRFGPADEERGRDDLVMSWCIAITCEATEAPVASYEVAEAPGGLIMPKDAPEEEW